MTIEHRTVKYYYALVWDSVLKDKDIVIKGQPLVASTKLPEDPRMMYGTSHKDIYKVRLTNFRDVVKYNTFTTEQSVSFEREYEEVNLTRDVRIVIWEWAETMSPKYDSYRIVSKQYFEELVKDAPESFGINKHPGGVESDEKIWKVTPNPERELKERVLRMLELDSESV